MQEASKKKVKFKISIIQNYAPYYSDTHTQKRDRSHKSSETLKANTIGKRLVILEFVKSKQNKQTRFYRGEIVRKR